MKTHNLPPNFNLSDHLTWEQVKKRPATDGESVMQSVDGKYFKRTGFSPAILAESALQADLHESGYPVPAIVEQGQDENGQYYWIEESVGEHTLHQMALLDWQATGEVSPSTLRLISHTGKMLLSAQIANATHADMQQKENSFKNSTFLENVYVENPDFAEDPQIVGAVEKCSNAIYSLHYALSNNDYGLPNILPGYVIDWHHAGLAPLGYDVYPALEIVRFKGGSKGYDFTQSQVDQYKNALDETAEAQLGIKLSGNNSHFLFMKSLFFAALMQPEKDHPRYADKLLKWQYRRHLVRQCAQEYLANGIITTSNFPSLEQFEETAANVNSL